MLARLDQAGEQAASFELYDVRRHGLNRAGNKIIRVAKIRNRHSTGWPMLRSDVPRRRRYFEIRSRPEVTDDWAKLLIAARSAEEFDIRPVFHRPFVPQRISPGTAKDKIA